MCGIEHGNQVQERDTSKQVKVDIRLAVDGRLSRLEIVLETHYD